MCVATLCATMHVQSDVLSGTTGSIKLATCCSCLSAIGEMARKLCKSFSVSGENENGLIGRKLTGKLIRYTNDVVYTPMKII
jgi:hypothetical protein